MVCAKSHIHITYTLFSYIHLVSLHTSCFPNHANSPSHLYHNTQGGVYDVTEWLDSHPGGAAKLMLAAGGAIDPYWAMYQQHNVPEVHKILEQYRIGNVKGYAEASAPKVGDGVDVVGVLLWVCC